MLLASLTFTSPPAGGGISAEELDSLAAAARHAVVMRGRTSVTATAELAPAADVAEFGAHAVENGQHSPEIAERDWWRRVLVRLTRDVTTGSPYTEPTHHRAGRVLELWQTGHKNWPIDTTQWTTNLDIDLMGFILDDAVTPLEVLEEMPPRLADPVEPAHARLTRRWARAVALFANAASDDTLTRADWVMVLNYADMTAVYHAFKNLTMDSGELYSAKHRRVLFGHLYATLDFGRAAGLMNDIPGAFARNANHRILDVEPNEDEIGKAIPETVIRQLDAHMGDLGRGITYGRLAENDIQAMCQMIYVILRDTGRRPNEVAALTRDCVEVIGGEHSLIYDNRKARRLRRRLPITAELAREILTWRQRVSRLPIPECSHGWLFPAITDTSGTPHIISNTISRIIRAWADAVPRLDSELPGPDGAPLPFDRLLVYPYAFRHSYAQRHADAGVAIDVLRDLMDHKDAQVTMGYYQVTAKRKREAMKALSRHVIDRGGRSAAFGSATAYEVRSVAVPFGNCVEPSNVKAGGQSCPIRFQCAGCGFYRPDPSYLLAIEEHLNSLRADRETAIALEVDDFVVRNLTDQITAFQQVADTMRETLARLSADERSEVEEASKVLRRSRAARGRSLPIVEVTQGPTAP
ncbi:tyrosine-type recombinase/integrase [Nonomuraea maheshkhaliensis]|uniref:tyrosine-type recombinase/integrase n=1 Tax=Nonomuraea maheshkhaliensis TaxID=419590 RepID=UPI0031FA10B8